MASLQVQVQCRAEGEGGLLAAALADRAGHRWAHPQLIKLDQDPIPPFKPQPPNNLPQLEHQKGLHYLSLFSLSPVITLLPGTLLDELQELL